MNDGNTKIIIAGFGGQGVVLAGKIIARAAMLEDKNVTMMISYGAEMRGGTANSTLVISDDEIASPFVERPDIAIIMNRPSLDKFESKIADNGIVILNSSLVDRGPLRDDLTVVRVGATQIAREMGNVRVANMVALGALVRAAAPVSARSLGLAVEEFFSAKKPALVEINKKAISAGSDAVES